ncbi:MAG: triose-phosphate isomerase [Pseudomonadota bacterium]
MATPVIRPLVAGNWKMNGTAASLIELDALSSLAAATPAGCDILVCPPFTLIAQASAKLKDTAIAVGAQDCHMNTSGAHTGDISAEMVKDLGGQYIIVGHSERRADHHETNDIVASKAAAAITSGLSAIVCVGETEEQRDAGHTLDVVADQIAGSIPPGASAHNTIVAYEPVWAIGTGKTPTVADVAQVHSFIRETLAERLVTGTQVRILYGGSVKPGNAAELMAADNVNGALVGGASLKASDFDGILNAYRSA